ncbi:hypothetical protein N9740_09285 [Pseudomonadales bacterium]|nr:hypothetical protein [Pseudomonadales bacterium]MDB9868877.1 hypothetical protein [Pseudomonadales bacterium]
MNKVIILAPVIVGKGVQLRDCIGMIAVPDKGEGSVLRRVTGIVQ